jgi:hypothetical protein
MSAVGEAFFENFSSRVFDPGIMNSQYVDPRSATIARIQSLSSAAATAPSIAPLPAPTLATERRDADTLTIDKFVGKRLIVQVNTPAGFETSTARIMHDLTGIGELVLNKELDKKEARKKGAGNTKRQKMQQQQDDSRCLSKIRLQKERVKSVRVSKRCAREDRRHCTHTSSSVV